MYSVYENSSNFSLTICAQLTLAKDSKLFVFAAIPGLEIQRKNSRQVKLLPKSQSKTELGEATLPPTLHRHKKHAPHKDTLEKEEDRRTDLSGGISKWRGVGGGNGRFLCISFLLPDSI